MNEVYIKIPATNFAVCVTNAIADVKRTQTGSLVLLQTVNVEVSTPQQEQIAAPNEPFVTRRSRQQNSMVFRERKTRPVRRCFRSTGLYARPVDCAYKLAAKIARFFLRQSAPRARPFAARVIS